MEGEKASSAVSIRDTRLVLAELEVPFAPEQVQWRVTNTAKGRNRGHVVPYADPRAYTDRLNTLFAPRGWTRDYHVETMGNITRIKGGQNIISGKILVTCTVTIIGLWSHSGTGEEWADEPNGLTSADAQSFKRACAVFGLGRYLYEFQGSWVDLDQNQQPKRIPALPAWAIPENWLKGMRPPGRNGNGNGVPVGPNWNAHSTPKSNGKQQGHGRILELERAVGPTLYGSVLREYGKAEHFKLITDASTKQRVVQIFESAMRGLDRLRAVKKRLDPKTLESFLVKIQAPPLAEIGI
jgi:hypothetical protein